MIQFTRYINNFTIAMSLMYLIPSQIQFLIFIFIFFLSFLCRVWGGGVGVAGWTDNVGNNLPINYILVAKVQTSCI